jgi:hypothetical protein
MKASRIVSLFALVVLLPSACANVAPTPESDSPQAYQSRARVSVDDEVYTIVGEIVGSIESTTRQTTPAYGYGYTYGTGSGSYGSYFGPETSGKGIVRVRVKSSETKLAPVGEVIVLKTTDLKAIVLLPGDIVRFKCRAELEPIAAVRNNETYNEEIVATWELDYCRMATPSISGE